jgi:uncharacterized membrane protein YecN with MAPEG domain
MNVYILCSAILVIFYFLLAFNVSMVRARTKVGIGPGDQLSGPLNRAIRAHGNASEFIPIFVLLFLYFNSVGAGGWIEWVVIAVTLCRVFHAFGMFLSPDLDKAYHLRFIGSLGTYLGGLAFGVALLLRVRPT